MSQENIKDVPVVFPYKPYGVQSSMMYRIIVSLDNKQNCLLESPTGTGKTMALLCSSLGWVQNEKNKNKLVSDNKRKNIIPVPKIFFGTRTHKQIGQAVREMGRSSYKSMPMTILSSRKRSCVNDQVLVKPDVDGACADACKSKKCSFKPNVAKIPSTSWDLESMKITLKKQLACPYFQCRKWTDPADIIFCPYNYILNPSIRRSMSIDLTNAIVILDEGHNIEDVCREGASIAIGLEQLCNFKFQVVNFVKIANDGEELRSRGTHVLKLISSLFTLVEFLASKLFFINDDVLKYTWNSREVIDHMTFHKLDQESLKGYKKSIQILDDFMNNHEQDNTKTIEMEIENAPKVSSTMLSTFKDLFAIFEYMFAELDSNQDDFRSVVTEEGSFIDPFQEQDNITSASGPFLSAEKRKKRKTERPNYTLNILCMHPGIVFKDIAVKTHSIILASGTLSPMFSFQRELSCNFDSSLEAPHVVKTNQTFVASIGCGPKGLSLSATYKNMKTFAIQDEFGGLLLQCCQTVPYGVLCFVSSFQTMDTLFKRWQATKLLNAIQEHKTVILEPRQSSEINQCMKDYYDYLDNGALMIAVYRGKVSEGMDFSDNAARLVIAVGIPYPSITDYKINLKKSYNDARVKSSEARGQYLSGTEWYSIQAYRALNQAIGRCIRHIDDWGAMIFVDDRFSADYYNVGLCKWIKTRKGHFEEWSPFISTLARFVQSHRKIEEKVL